MFVPHSVGDDLYEAAVAALREDAQQWWAETLARDPAELEEDEEQFTADAEKLRRLLEGGVLPWFEARRSELANRSLIREQAFGESLDPDKLERLGRYEVHLDQPVYDVNRGLAERMPCAKCGRFPTRSRPGLPQRRSERLSKGARGSDSQRQARTGWKKSSLGLDCMTGAHQAETIPQHAEEHRSLLRRALDFVFGYDYFISYAWRDGMAYATALARQLSADGYEVFLDQVRFVSGDDWKEVAGWTLRRTELDPGFRTIG